MTGDRWLGLLVIGLSLLTAPQVARWSDDRALWASALRVTPARPRVLINLGVARARIGDYDGALALYARAEQAAMDPRRAATRAAVLRVLQRNRDAALWLRDHR